MAFWNKKKDESDMQEYSVSYKQDPTTWSVQELFMEPPKISEMGPAKISERANAVLKSILEPVDQGVLERIAKSLAPKPLCVDCKHCYKVNSPQHMCKLPVINLVTGGELAKNTLCIDERLGKKIYENLDNCGLEGKFYKSRVEAC